MQANANEMGKEFLLLYKAHNDVELADALREWAGNDTHLLDCYTIALNEEEDWTLCKAEQMSAVQIVQIEAVAVWGNKDAMRCLGVETWAYEDCEGRIWLDMQLHDEVFC